MGSRGHWSATSKRKKDNTFPRKPEKSLVRTRCSSEPNLPFPVFEANLALEEDIGEPVLGLRLGRAGPAA